MQNRTVAIVGSHPRTKDLAPFADKSIDIWVFNEVAGKGQIPRADLVFQMHKPAIWKNPNNRNDPKHYDWLKTNTETPVVMLDSYPEIPACRSYPLEGVCAEISGFTRTNGQQIRYFTSTVAYAIGEAIRAGYKRLLLYGVEMETNTEYAYQRDGVYFWLGVAVGRGIEVEICDQSELFRSPLYGYEGDVELNPAEFGKRVIELEPQTPHFKAGMEAARQAQDDALRLAMSDTEKRGEHLKAFFAAINKQCDAVIAYGVNLGRVEENKRYQAKADAMEQGPAQAVLFSRQEFEQTAAKAADMQHKYEALMHTTGASAIKAWNDLQAMEKEPASQKAKNRQSSVYLESHKRYMESALQFGRFTGMVQENLRYMEIVDELVRMAGGEKSEEAMLAWREMEDVRV